MSDYERRFQCRSWDRVAELLCATRVWQVANWNPKDDSRQLLHPVTGVMVGEQTSPLSVSLHNSVPLPQCSGEGAENRVVSLTLLRRLLVPTFLTGCSSDYRPSLQASQNMMQKVRFEPDDSLRAVESDSERFQRHMC